MTSISEEKYTDLEETHIQDLVHKIKKKHANPTITNIYPVYNDMIYDLKRNCSVNTSAHKKVVTIGALKQIFKSKNELKHKENMQIIEHHKQTIDHLLHVFPSKRDGGETCERCKKSCVIL